MTWISHARIVYDFMVHRIFIDLKMLFSVGMLWLSAEFLALIQGSRIYFGYAAIAYFTSEFENNGNV